MVDSQILNSIYGMIDQFIAFIPVLVAVIILLILGLFLGKLFGKIGSRILDKIGLDDLINKTMIGDIVLSDFSVL